jgi:hypothetical protein
VILSSEVGVLDIPAERILHKGRLQPGRMLLVDTEQGRIIADDELKHSIASERPYGEWLRQNLITLKDLPPPATVIEPLRLRIDASGALTLYAIAIDRVPRRWRAQQRNGEQTWVAIDSRATAPRLIDKVVVRP